MNVEAEESGREHGLTAVEKHELRCCHMRPRGAWAEEDPAKKAQEVQRSLTSAAWLAGAIGRSLKKGMDDGFARGSTWLALAAWRHAVCPSVSSD